MDDLQYTRRAQVQLIGLLCTGLSKNTYSHQSMTVNQMTLVLLRPALLSAHIPN